MPIPLLPSILVMDGERSRRPAVPALAAYGGLVVADRIDDFTEDAVVNHGVAGGEHFLSKPFTPADLAHKVQEVLGVTGDIV